MLLGKIPCSWSNLIPGKVIYGCLAGNCSIVVHDKDNMLLTQTFSSILLWVQPMGLNDP